MYVMYIFTYVYFLIYILLRTLMIAAYETLNSVSHMSFDINIFVFFFYIKLYY